MPEQRSGERDVRQERAGRILDAAATLIQRWGYNKTTLDDIARQARVARGTIYLHWKTREELLAALLAREYLRVAEDLRQRMQEDPQGATLRGFAKHSMLAILKNPLMRAMMARDTDMLGKWADQAYGHAALTRRIDEYKHFMETLRAQGLIGTDLDIYAQTYILGAIWMGFLTSNDWLPQEFRFSDEAIADLLAETIQRTLAPQQTDARQDHSEVADIFHQYIEQDLHILQEGQKEQSL
ncbi:MAG TPA: helix-turn-helix domain-containing protein [Ktedonobacteraceae bacterium]